MLLGALRAYAPIIGVASHEFLSIRTDTGTASALIPRELRSLNARMRWRL